MPNLIALWTVTHYSLASSWLLTRLEADDWGDTADGTQYGQDDHWNTEHYDESYDHDYHDAGPEEQEDYQGADPKEQEYPEQSNEQRHNQEGVTGESEDEYQEE